jgi:hypothetical protein
MDKQARAASVLPPTTWQGTQTVTIALLRDFLDDTIKELRERRDWEEPIGDDFIANGPGTIVDEASVIDLPTQWSRPTRDALAVYERTTTRRRGLPITTSGKWTALKSVGTAGAYRYFRITGTPGAFKINFFRPLGTNDKITLSYVTDYWTLDADTSMAKSIWDKDTDTLLYEDRVVELGVRWRWLQHKGLNYDPFLAQYEAYLARDANDSRLERNIVFGENVDDFRAPWDVPVPDFIPPTSS